MWMRLTGRRISHRNGDENMKEKGTDRDLELFMDAYQFYKEHPNPPSFYDLGNYLSWWTNTRMDMAELQIKWEERYPLINRLLKSIICCLQYEAGTKKEEEEEIVQEQ